MVPNGTRPREVLSVERHGVPDAVVQSRKNNYATNDPALMGKVNLIQRTVRMMDERNQIKSEVRDDNRPSRNLSPRQSDTLAARGVSVVPDYTADMLPERSNHGCLSEHRPDPSKGGGDGRAFVPWCSKKGGR